MYYLALFFLISFISYLFYFIFICFWCLWDVVCGGALCLAPLVVTVRLWFRTLGLGCWWEILMGTELHRKAVWIKLFITSMHGNWSLVMLTTGWVCEVNTLHSNRGKKLWCFCSTGRLPIHGIYILYLFRLNVYTLTDIFSRLRDCLI